MPKQGLKKAVIKRAYWTVFAIVCVSELSHTRAQTNNTHKQNFFFLFTHHPKCSVLSSLRIIAVCLIFFLTTGLRDPDAVEGVQRAGRVG